MRRQLSLLAVAALALALTGCIAPPPLPSASVDAAAPQTASPTEGQGADASQQPGAPVWPANMASYGVIFTAEGVLETPRAGAQREEVAVAAPHAILYVDFSCPHCGTFTRTHAGDLAAAVDAGEIVLELRPMAFLDSATNDEHSTRAANAFAAVVDEFPESAWAYYVALFEAQQEGSEAGLPDDGLIELASSTGAASEQLTARIEAVALRDFTAAATSAGLEQPISAGGPTITGTPSLFLDGVQFTGGNDEPGAVATFIADQT